MGGGQGATCADFTDPPERVGVTAPGGPKPFLGDPPKMVKDRVARKGRHDVSSAASGPRSGMKATASLSLWRRS